MKNIKYYLAISATMLSSSYAWKIIDASNEAEEDGSQINETYQLFLRHIDSHDFAQIWAVGGTCFPHFISFICAHLEILV